MVIKAYDSFLLNNASQITAVESSLRSLTYFLPGRFKDAELAGEAIYSAMNLLGLYHDEILKRLVIYRDINVDGPQQTRRLPSKPVQPLDGTSSDQPLLPHTPSSHARYTNYYSDKSPAYKTMARLLVVIGYTELLAEMVARRKLSRSKAWDVVLGIEAVKASLRLALFSISESRLSINPPVPEREVDPAMLETEREEALLARLREASASAAVSSTTSTGEQRGITATEGVSSPARSSSARADTWTGSRTGFVRPTLASLRKDDRPIDPVTGRPIPDSPASLNLPSGSRPTSRSRSRSRLSSHSDTDSDSSDETLVEPASGSATTTPFTQQSIDSYLTSRALTREDVLPPPTLVRSFANSKRGTTAELLWILRPIFYLLAIRKWGARRWEPWTISLVTEALSHFLRGSAYKSPALMSGTQKSHLAPLQMMLTLLTSSSNPLFKLVAHLGRKTLATTQPVSQVESEEWSRRKRAFLWYLLRGPLWETWTKKKVVAVCDRWEDKAVLGLGASMAREYVPLVDGLWFYTASQ